MFKATISSKGQLTIPKEIREELGLQTGDVVVLKINNENKTVTLEKDKEIIPCPVCNGFGTFNINNLPCFICDQTGYVKANSTALETFLEIKARKYGVAISIIQQELDSNDNLIIKEIPEVRLASKKYMEPMLNIAHDYLQMKFIKEYISKILSDSQQKVVLSDQLLNEALSLLKRDVAKETVRTWFNIN